MKNCPNCGRDIIFKVVSKETFPVNVLSKEEYSKYLTQHPELTMRTRSREELGSFCPWCGIELIELLQEKKS
jgi:hypothetical protein